MRLLRLKCTVAAGAAALSVVVCLAQSDTAQISGYVRDPAQAVVPNASVTIRNEATGLARNTAANESGYYVIPSLPPGYYTLTVEAPGFKKFVKTQNKLDANIALAVSVDLEVGAVAETVEVVASVAQLQSETATVGKLIENTTIQNTILNGRNPIFLALLKPGVRTGSSLASFNFSMTSGGFSINGGRTQDLLITFDGAVAVRTRANGTSIGAVDIDSVQEMQVLTANYNAEFGRAAAGQIRLVTKSGTQNFHGSAYEYFRNDNLDANTWARNRAGLPVEARKFNQFGYVFSGPVFIPNKFNKDRNKVFFLWSQEWVRYRREDTTIQTVPSLAMRRGDFSELLSASNTFFGRVRTINDPSTGQPFANNVIPASRLSLNGIGLLNSYPEPTPGFIQGTNNFIQTQPNPQNQRKDTVSTDFNFTERHAVRVRWQNFNWTAVDAFRTGFDRAVTDWSRPNMTGSVNYVWTVSPRMVNEFLATASVDRVYIGIYRPGEKFLRSKYGINYPYIFSDRKEIQDKIPTTQISNFGTIDGGPYPSQSTGPIYNFSNNTSLIRGNHTIKWGVAFERLGQNDFDQINVSGVPGGTNNQNGRFVFTDTRGGAPSTGIAVGNTALGLFDTYAEIGTRAFTPYRSHTFEWFVQDSWRVSEKLKLELGLRYTYMNPYFRSLWGNMAVFDPKRYDPSKAVVQDPRTGNILGGDRYNGVLIPGTGFPDAAKGRVPIADTGEFNRLFNGGSVYWGEAQKLNFQPRFGLAYSLNPKTVIRAGGGRFMARPGVSDNIFLGGNPPFQPMASISNGSVDNPGGGARTGFPQFFMTSDPVFRIPNAWSWSVAVQREIGFNTTVEVGYVGRVGLNLERERELNQLQPGTRQRPENAGLDVNFLRPFKGFAFIPLGETAARSEYSGLQLEVNRRFSKGLSFGFAYTYAESFDNASDRRARLYNALDDRNYWGHSNFDTRHVAVLNSVYQLPFLRDNTTPAGKLLGGWVLSAAIQFQTGSPFTVTTTDDFAGTGNSDAVPWNMSTNPSLSRGDRAFSEGAADSNFWFRPRNTDGSAIFTAPAAGTYGSQERNALYNPGFQNWNLGLVKDFVVTEQQKLTLRGEFFNFPNHPNWSNPTSDPRSGTFGKVTQKTSERNIQLSLRYSF